MDSIMNLKRPSSETHYIEMRVIGQSNRPIPSRNKHLLSLPCLKGMVRARVREAKIRLRLRKFKIRSIFYDNQSIVII